MMMMRLPTHVAPMPLPAEEPVCDSGDTDVIMIGGSAIFAMLPLPKASKAEALADANHGWPSQFG